MYLFYKEPQNTKTKSLFQKNQFVLKSFINHLEKCELDSKPSFMQQTIKQLKKSQFLKSISKNEKRLTKN